MIISLPESQSMMSNCLNENLTIETIDISKRMLPLGPYYRSTKGTFYDFKKQT
jgi:hypothetical protein